MYEELREAVCNANIELHRQRLAIFSWGNVSGIEHQAGVVAIKPSGFAYDMLEPKKLVIVDLDGNIVEGGLYPSSDTPTHLELYKNFKDIGSVCHTHSRYATMWAQACKEIPCFGTTHADYFHGPVPITDMMNTEQIHHEYEVNTGKVIVEQFNKVDHMRIPAVLVANHGPFTWGETPAEAVENAVVLEEIALIALGTLNINPKQKNIGHVLLDKHYFRKHGNDAYYGQR